MNIKSTHRFSTEDDVFSSSGYEREEYESDDAESHPFFHSASLPTNYMDATSATDEHFPFEQYSPHILAQAIRAICASRPSVKRELNYFLRERQIQAEEYNRTQLRLRIIAVQDRIQILSNRVRDKLYIDCYTKDLNNWDEGIPFIAQEILDMIEKYVIEPHRCHMDNVCTSLTLLEACTKQFRHSYLDTKILKNKAQAILDLEEQVEDKLFK